MDNKSFALLNGPNFNLLEAYFNSITYSINKFIGFSFSAKSFWKKKRKRVFTTADYGLVKLTVTALFGMG